MTAPIFVDTNLLVYALDEADPKKHRAARDWRADLWKSRRGRVSYQVLQELYVTVVRKRPSACSDVRAEIRDLLAWRPVVIDAGMIERGWAVQDRYRLSFWDSLIVAAAQSASCRYLLTEDLQPGQDFDGVLVVNPLVSAPASLE